MNPFRLPLATAALFLVAACGNDARPVTARPTVADTVARSAPAAPLWLTDARRVEEEPVFASASAAAWRFANRNYVQATGLTRPFDAYPIGTMWDVASGLAALFAASELGLLSRADFDVRISRALRTLGELPLYDKAGFNKEYVLSSGVLITIDRRPGREGYGTSATDTGRLLLWLRIIANRHPSHRAEIDRVVKRLKLPEHVRDGYLVGRQLSRRSGDTRKYQEGRIGYEQYAAHGFEVWGTRAENALDIEHNMKGRTIYGVEVPKDTRGGDRLTSEPFILLGMEAGWTAAERRIAERLLAVQAARYTQSDTLTMVSEDAINIPPHYFFYYTILSSAGPFTIEVQRPVRVNSPRWLSTKAAFSWHALLPGDYTQRVLQEVRARAMVHDVWGAGVMENGRATGNPNLNTAAVVLEAAAYRKVGRPFLSLPALAP